MSEKFFSDSVDVNRPYFVPAPGQAFTFLILPAVTPSRFFFAMLVYSPSSSASLTEHEAGRCIHIHNQLEARLACLSLQSAACEC